MPETRLERARRAYDRADTDCERLLQSLDGLSARSRQPLVATVAATVIAAARLADAGRALIWTQSVEDID